MTRDDLSKLIHANEQLSASNMQFWRGLEPCAREMLYQMSCEFFKLHNHLQNPLHAMLFIFAQERMAEMWERLLREEKDEEL